MKDEGRVYEGRHTRDEGTSHPMSSAFNEVLCNGCTRDEGRNVQGTSDP